MVNEDVKNDRHDGPVLTGQLAVQRFEYPMKDEAMRDLVRALMAARIGEAE